jgi:hypothetical protein
MLFSGLIALALMNRAGALRSGLSWQGLRGGYAYAYRGGLKLPYIGRHQALLSLSMASTTHTSSTFSVEEFVKDAMSLPQLGLRVTPLDQLSPSDPSDLSAGKHIAYNVY